MADEMKPAPSDVFRVFNLEYFDDGVPKAGIVLDGEYRRVAMESLRDHTLVSLRGELTGHGSRKTIEDIRDLHTVS